MASNPIYVQSSEIQPRTAPSEPMKYSKHLQIISDAKCGEAILWNHMQESNTSGQYGTIAHSSALKIETPSPSHTPPNILIRFIASDHSYAIRNESVNTKVIPHKLRYKRNCPYCSKIYDTWHLSRHIQNVHSKKNLQQCGHCWRIFAKQGMDKHQRKCANKIFVRHT